MTTRRATGPVLVDGGVVRVCAPMFAAEWQGQPFAAMRRGWASARFERWVV